MLASGTSAELAKAQLVLLLAILVHRMVINNEVYASRKVTQAFRRRVISPTRRLWPNATIPYVIDCSIANVINAKAIIKASMAEWEKRTCVRFVKRTNQQGYLLVRRYRGCHADIGYLGSRYVRLSLGDGCDQKFVVMHELGHIIGFHHEHQRHDRDRYIEILWNNVKTSGLRHQFVKRKKMDELDGKLPYDYSSIMHYRFDAFSKRRGLNTIKARNKYIKNVRRPYNYLTDLDVKKTAALYNCLIDESQLRSTTTVPTTKPTLKSTVKPTGVEISIRSAGWYSGKDKRVSILVNGSEYSRNSWGINVVQISYISGRRTHSASFSISRREKARSFARELKKLPKRHYVIIVSKTGSLNNLREAKREIEALGGNIPRRFRPGTAYCLIGYKGDEKVHVKQLLGDPKEVLNFSMTLKLAADYRCQDDIAECQSKIGDCIRYPKYFMRVCQKSCGACKPARPCEDEHKYCSQWAKYDNCQKRPDYMLKACKVSCGVCWKVLPAVVEKPQRTGAKLLKHFRQTAARTYGESQEDDDDEEDNHGATGIKCADKSRNCPTYERENRCRTASWVKKNCLLSCYKAQRRPLCDKEQIRPEGSCFRPLGLGWNRRLPDHSFTSSSVMKLKGSWNAAAYNARLYMEDDRRKRRIGCWCARNPPRNGNEWLKIDLVKIRNVRAVATQGRFRYYEHVKTFRLSFSKDGKRWYYYKEGRRVKVFDGNCDHQTPVLNILSKPVVARYVRFHPIRYYGKICMRVEVFGCRLNERT